MDATITPSIISLVARLQTDYPNYLFQNSLEFRWSPQEKTIFYDIKANDTASLLHELAHCLLGHTEYQRDVELITMERAAWNYACKILAPTYETIITIEQIEDALDTYRNWLHARSTCPHCQATGLQIKDYTYRCFSCFTQWRVNDARACALRRWKTSSKQK